MSPVRCWRPEIGSWKLSGAGINYSLSIVAGNREVSTEATDSVQDCKLPPGQSTDADRWSLEQVLTRLKVSVAYDLLAVINGIGARLAIVHHRVGIVESSISGCAEFISDLLCVPSDS